MVPRRFLPVFALLTSCFALWGLLNNMTDNLVPAFQKIFGTSQSTAGFVQVSFYGAYSVVALLASWIWAIVGVLFGIIVGALLVFLWHIHKTHSKQKKEKPLPDFYPFK